MAKDYYDEANKDGEKEVNDSSKIYMYNMFAPDSKKLKGGELALLDAALQQFGINAAVTLSTWGLGKTLKAVKPSVTKNIKEHFSGLKDKIKGRKLPYFENLSDEQIEKLIKEAGKKELEITGRVSRLLDATSKGQVTKEEFLAEMVNSGREAWRYFFEYDTPKAREALVDAWRNVGSLSGKEKDELIDKFMNSALKEEDIRYILAKGQDALEPLYTYIHTVSTGKQFEKILDIPEVRQWLKTYGLDARELKPYAYIFAKNHDFGKTIVPQHYINSPKRYEPGSPEKLAISEHERGGEKVYEKLLTKEKNYDERAKAGFVDTLGTGTRLPVGVGSWSAKNPFALDMGEETFTSILKKHGGVEAHSPLSVLFNWLDEANAYVNPRSYKEGGDMAKFPESWANTKVIKNRDLESKGYSLTNRDNLPVHLFPENVHKALLRDYPKIVEETKTGFEPFLGKLALAEKGTGVFSLMDDEMKRLVKLGHKVEPVSKEMKKKGIKYILDGSPVYATFGSMVNNLFRTAKEESADTPRKLKLQNDIYNQYKKAHPVSITDPDTNPYALSREPRGKIERSVEDFAAGMLGLNQSANVADVANNADDMVGFTYLNDFYNNNVKDNKNIDDNKKQSIKAILDNWSDLSYDDRGHFLRDISHRYKDVIESPDYKYD